MILKSWHVGLHVDFQLEAKNFEPTWFLQVQDFRKSVLMEQRVHHPKRMLLVPQIDKERSCQKVHALSVTPLVVVNGHTIQHIEEHLLALVALPEELKGRECPIYIFSNIICESTALMEETLEQLGLLSLISKELAFKLPVLNPLNRVREPFNQKFFQSPLHNPQHSFVFISPQRFPEELA